MKKTVVVQYNAILDIDLFYTIYDWMRWHQTALERDFKVRTMYDFDKLTLEDWIDLADTAIMWLEREQLPNVIKMNDDCPAPSNDKHGGFGTLYYQTLAYMSNYHAFEPTYRSRDLEGQKVMCKECIENLKKLRNEIREPNDNDI